MIPLKNGVVLYSQEYSCYFRADVYRLSGWGWLFRVNNTRIFNDDSQREQFKVHRIEGWFDENTQFGTILVRDSECLVDDSFYDDLKEIGVLYVR